MAFVRMLAKIGYGCAVAHLGSFPRHEAPVLPLILGTADDGGNWVGSADFHLSVEEATPTHALSLVSLTAVVDGIDEEITLARVKLFSSAGATGYEIVVRRKSK